MRAVVVGEPGGPDALTTAELPDPMPGAGQVVVAVEAAGVNPVDLGNRSDAGWSGVESPYVVGYEFAGTVAELDGTPTDLVVGDPVWGLLPVRGTRWGAYAERVAVDMAFVAPRPAGLELVEAATLPLAGGTAMQVLDRLGLPEGSWLLVHGAAGGVGHLMVQLAAIRGLRVAAVSGGVDRRRLLGLGAELWVDRAGPGSPAADAATQLGHDLDAAVDLVGGQLVRAQAHVRDGEDSPPSSTSRATSVRRSTATSASTASCSGRAATCSTAWPRPSGPGCGRPFGECSTLRKRLPPTSSWKPAEWAASSP